MIYSNNFFGFQRSNTLTPMKPHNHGPDAFQPNVEIRNLLKRKAAESLGTHSKRQLFNSITREHPEGNEIGFASIEKSLQRAQRRAQLRVPQSAAEAVELLEEAAAYNKYFQGSITDDEGEVAILLYAEELAHILPEIENISYDGTFFTTPEHFYQLFTVHALYLDHSFPIVTALMTRKTESLYRKVFEKINEKLPSLKPKQAMGDFETSSANALAHVYPEVELAGCQFHFSQAIWRKVQKVSLASTYRENEKFRTFIRKVMSLAYLPADKIQATTDVLFQETFESLPLSKQQQIGQFKQYVRRFWLTKVGVEKLSVFSFSRATNNDSENFHGRLKTIVKTHHPNFWVFLYHIQNIFTDALNDMQRLENGLAITRKSRTKFVRNSQRRAVLKEKLTNQLITPIQYVSAISFTFDPASIVSENLDRLGLETDQTEEEEEIPQEVANHNSCVICLGARVGTKVFVPCGHGGCAACVDQLLQMENPSCAVCRAPVVQAIQIFL